MPDFNQLFANAGVRVVKPETMTDFSLLLFGMAGSGKSSLAATASKVPDLSPVLYIDFEGGTLPLVEHGDTSKITIVHCDDWSDFENVSKKVILPALRKKEFPFKTVVIDTVDLMQELIVRHYGEANGGDGYAKWAAAYEQPVSILSKLFNYPGLSVIAITHATREQDQVTGAALISPTFEGRKSLTRLPSLFDFVGYLAWTEVEKGKNVPVLYLQQPGIVTKKKLASIPSAIGNPDLGKLYRFIADAVKGRK